MNKSPNILIIQQSPDWGGAEEWMFSLIKQFSTHIKVHLATNYEVLANKTTKYTTSQKKIPFTLDIIGNKKGLIKSVILFIPATIWYIKTLISYKSLGINCILMSGFSEKILVSIIAQVLDIKVIWFEYGPLNQVFSKNFYLPKVLYRFTKDIPEKVITISENTKQALINDAKVSLSKLEVIYPGTKVPSKKPKYHSDPIIVGHLSRLSEEKGQRIMLRAWKKVLRKLPQAKLVIAGKGPDLDYLKNLSKKLHIQNSVEFLGFIDNKKNFYKNLSLFVFPGIWEMEGFGIAMIEALSFGIPVVVIDNGPAREIVTKDVGRLSGKSPRQLSDQIIGIIKASQLKKQSQAAYNKAKTKYNLTIQAQKVLDEINRAIN